MGHRTRGAQSATIGGGGPRDPDRMHRRERDGRSRRDHALLRPRLATSCASCSTIWRSDPGVPRAFPVIEDAMGWPRRRISSRARRDRAHPQARVRRPAPVPLPGRAPVGVRALGDLDGLQTRRSVVTRIRSSSDAPVIPTASSASPATPAPRQLHDAYRRLVKQTHPDRPGGSAEAFKEVQAAYEELRNRPRPTERPDIHDRMSKLEDELREAHRARDAAAGRRPRGRRGRRSARPRRRAPRPAALTHRRGGRGGQLLQDPRGRRSTSSATGSRGARQHPAVQRVGDLIDGLDDLASRLDKKGLGASGAAHRPAARGVRRARRAKSPTPTRATSAAPPSARLVVVGDSLAAGRIADSPDEAFPQLVAAATNARARRCSGMPGATTAQLAAQPVPGRGRRRGRRGGHQRRDQPDRRARGSRPTTAPCSPRSRLPHPVPSSSA